MKLFSKSKDGGPESTVTGYFLVEIKNLFSIVLLKFEGQSREAFHTHAFNCISWVLKGKLVEQLRYGYVKRYPASLKPVMTYRDTFHKVDSVGTTWVLSFRGPWSKTWTEYIPASKETHTLINGRVVTHKEIVER